MPLSEREQQVLAQIERELNSDDAKLAKRLRSANAVDYAVRRLRRAAFLFVLGMATLVFAVTADAATASVLLGLLGFIVMLLAALRASTVLRQLPIWQRHSQRPRSPKASVTFQSLAKRVQERWQQRPGK
jgi:hypothetical protein